MHVLPDYCMAELRNSYFNGIEKSNRSSSFLQSSSRKRHSNDAISADIFHFIHKSATDHIIMGLQPGEMYALQLNTMTANIASQKPIQDMFMTKPLTPESFHAKHIGARYHSMNT